MLLIKPKVSIAGLDLSVSDTLTLIVGVDVICMCLCCARYSTVSNFKYSGHYTPVNFIYTSLLYESGVKCNELTILCCEGFQLLGPQHFCIWMLLWGSFHGKRWK